MPRKGVMRIWTASVIHHVSTTGQRSNLITSRNQTHPSTTANFAHGPQDPQRSQIRDGPGYPLPQRMNARGLGVVERCIGSWRCAFRQSSEAVLIGIVRRALVMMQVAPAGERNKDDIRVGSPPNRRRPCISRRLPSFRSKMSASVQAFPTRKIKKKEHPFGLTRVPDVYRMQIGCSNHVPISHLTLSRARCHQICRGPTSSTRPSRRRCG